MLTVSDTSNVVQGSFHSFTLPCPMFPVGRGFFPSDKAEHIGLLAINPHYTQNAQNRDSVCNAWFRQLSDYAAEITNETKQESWVRRSFRLSYLAKYPSR